MAGYGEGTYGEGTYGEGEAPPPATYEGYATVSELLGFSSVYGFRDGMADVVSSVGVPLPVYIEVDQPRRGWGTPLQPERTLVYKGESTADVVLEVETG